MNPAIHVLARLSYPNRLILIAALFAVPAAFAGWAYTSETNSKIAFSEKERVGIRYVEPVSELLGKLVAARHVAVTAAAEGREVPAPAVGDQLKAVAAADRELGAELQTTPLWNDLQREIDDLKSPPQTALAAFDAYGEATAVALALIVQAGDVSNLILDPDLDSYYVMNVIITKLPVMTDTIGAARDRLIAEQGTLSINLRIALAVENGIVHDAVDEATRGLETSFKSTADPQLARQLAGPLERLHARIVEASANVERAVHGDASDVTSSTSMAAASAAELNAMLPAHLDRLLVTRIDGFRAASRQVQAVLGVGLVIALFAFAALYALATRTLRELLDVSEARYVDLIEQLPTITYTKLRAAGDGAIEVSFISRQAQTMLEIAPDRFLADPDLWLETVHPDDRARVTDELAALFAGEAPLRSEYRFVSPVTGVTVWVHDEGSAIAQLAGGPVHVQGFILDISDRKRAEAEQERVETELRLGQKLEAVGQLAAGIAHEINTPMQYVGHGLAFLQESFDDVLAVIREYEAALTEMNAPPELRERLEKVRLEKDLDYVIERMPPAFERSLAGVERVVTIVRAMKEFAHPGDAHERTPSDLNAAIESTLIVASNEIRYVADVAVELDELPPVVCNLGDINQVFLNLIVNAAHAIDEHEADRGTITVRSRHDGDHVEFEIADTGCGVPDHIRDRIFDPFFTTKPVGKGTGQGLALARTFVERNGGVLSLASTPGEGTTFTVRLPIEQPGLVVPDLAPA